MPGIGVNLRVTGHCNQGGRKYMEDMFTVAYHQTADLQDYEYAYFGIFDGHGGPEAAAYAKDNLIAKIVTNSGFWSETDEHILKAIFDGYVQTQIDMEKDHYNWPKTASGLPSTSGTTATVAFIRRGKLYVGHVGDTSLVLGYEEKGQTAWKAQALTTDHKPECQAEIERIHRYGGKVITKSGVPRVVWNRPRLGHQGPVRRSTPRDEIPFLAVARALGDFWSYNSHNGKYIVTPEPDVFVIPVDVHKHRCLILGTDGLWNMLSPSTAVAIVQSTENHNEKQSKDWLNPSKNLVDRAITYWAARKQRADNTSAVTLMIDPPGRAKMKFQLCQPRPSGLQGANGKLTDMNAFMSHPKVFKMYHKPTSDVVSVFARHLSATSHKPPIPVLFTGPVLPKIQSTPSETRPIVKPVTTTAEKNKSLNVTGPNENVECDKSEKEENNNTIKRKDKVQNNEISSTDLNLVPEFPGQSLQLTQSASKTSSTLLKMNSMSPSIKRKLDPDHNNQQSSSTSQNKQKCQRTPLPENVDGTSDIENKIHYEKSLSPNCDQTKKNKRRKCSIEHSTKRIGRYTRASQSCFTAISETQPRKFEVPLSQVKLSRIAETSSTRMLRSKSLSVTPIIKTPRSRNRTPALITKAKSTDIKLRSGVPKCTTEVSTPKMVRRSNTISCISSTTPQVKVLKSYSCGRTSKRLSQSASSLPQSSRVTTRNASRQSLL